MSNDILYHHIVVAMTVIWLNSNGIGNYALTTGLAGGECSNPAMHIRHFFRIVGLRYSKAYDYAQTMYFSTFVIGRATVANIGFL